MRAPPAQRGPARRPADRGSSPCRPRRARPGGDEVERVAPGLDPAHADHRDLDRGGDTARPAPARSSAPPGPKAAAAARPARAPRSPGRSRAAFRVLISETASAPPSSAATATAAGSATFGVSFTISGLPVSGRRAPSEPAVSVGLLADDQPRVHVRAGDVELDRGDLVAAATALDQPARTPRRSSPSPRRSAARGARRAAAGRVEEAVEALVREPDRVDHPGRGLPEPRRRVAGSRLGGDRLRDEGGEREALEQRVAEGASGGDRIEGAGAVDDRVRERDPAELERRSTIIGAPLPATSAVSISSPRTTGPSMQRRM